MKKSLRMKCSNCGHWNRVPVNKIFLEQNTIEPKVKVFIPMYKPLQVSKCEKFGEAVTEPKELIRIVKNRKESLKKRIICLLFTQIFCVLLKSNA